jgi:hypothetical protein
MSGYLKGTERLRYDVGIEDNVWDCFHRVLTRLSERRPVV